MKYLKLHIIIPYYSNAKYLHETIDGVLNQSSSDWLLTIIDDAGPEDESKYVKSLNDKRINYIRHKVNKGIQYTFNEATRITKSPIHTITGPDDRLLPDYVKRTLEIFNEYPNVAYYIPNVYVIDENGKRYLPLGDKVKKFLRRTVSSKKKPTLVTGNKLLVSLLHGDWINSPSVVFNQDNITAKEQFNTKLDITLDFEEYSRAALRGDLFLIDNEKTFEYRRHKASYSMKPEVMKKRFAQEDVFYDEIATELKGKPGYEKSYNAAKFRITSRLHRTIFYSKHVFKGKK